MNKKTLIVYGSDTGITEKITKTIVYNWICGDVDVIDVSYARKEDFEGYDLILLGLSTWFDGHLQSDWSKFLSEFKTMNFKNKTFALYGLGDQVYYPGYFIDGVGKLAEIILQNGGNIIGKWPIDDYNFTKSKALTKEGYFYGLALDEKNEPEKTNYRINKWISCLEGSSVFRINLVKV